MVDYRYRRFRPVNSLMACFVLLGAAALSLACASRSTRQPDDTCAPWVRSPAQSRWDPEHTLLGVGGAPRSDPDAASRARQAGVGELAEQVSVQVRASLESEQRVVVHQRGVGAEGRAPDARTDDSAVTRRVETVAEVFLVGASVLDTCESRSHVYALIGLDRAELGDFARSRLKELNRDVAERLERAEQDEAEGAWLTAAAAWRRASDWLAELDTRRLVARVVSRASLEDSATLTAAAAEARASLALSRARVSLSVRSPAATEVLQEALRVRLRAIGLPLTEAPTHERIEARVAIRQPEEAAAGLYVAYASLTLEIELADGTVAFSQSVDAKSSGLSTGAAARDVVVRLARDAVPGLVDRALAQLGWPEK